MPPDPPKCSLGLLTAMHVTYLFNNLRTGLIGPLQGMFTHFSFQHRTFCRIRTQLSLQRGFSPVYSASENGHTEVVDLLVQAGADIHLATTAKVHVNTHTVSSSVAAVVETNVRLIVFVV